jgi:hypothetical protein
LLFKRFSTVVTRMLEVKGLERKPATATATATALRNFTWQRGTRHSRRRREVLAGFRFQNEGRRDI